MRLFSHFLKHTYPKSQLERKGSKAEVMAEPITKRNEHKVWYVERIQHLVCTHVSRFSVHAASPTRK